MSEGFGTDEAVQLYAFGVAAEEEAQRTAIFKPWGLELSLEMEAALAQLAVEGNV